MGYLKYTHGSSFVPPPGHNGGKSQTNLTYLYATPGGDNAFLNVMKLSSPPLFVDGANTPVTPDLLDANGYPLAVGAHLGFHWAPMIQPGSERPGNYIITWDGTGSIAGTGAGGSQLGTATFTGSISGNVLTIPGSISGTIQRGQRVTGGTTLPYTFIMSGSGTTYIVSKSQTVASVAMTADGGDTSSSGGAGAGFYAMTVDNVSGNVQFKITGVGSPIITNVQIYHVDDAALIAAGEIFGTEFLRRLREANFGVIRFLNWQDNPSTNMATWSTRKPASYMYYMGDQLNNDFYAGTATHTGNAYVTSRFPPFHSSDGSAWTSGGPKNHDTVIVSFINSATQSGTCSLSIGTSGIAVNILDGFGGPLAEGGTGGGGIFYPIGGTAQSFGTLIYDADLAGWLLYGSNNGPSGAGIRNVVPFEISLQLCNEVGAHPYFVLPCLSLDPATDFAAELAQLCKTYSAANAPWMIPRFEGPNETWAGGSYATALAGRKAALHWGGTADFRDGYGKWMANLGQMCAGVYGLPDKGHTYHVLCGVHSSGTSSESEEKLSSSLYVAQAGPADPAVTGSFGTISFTKQAAKLTTSHVACVQYISPAERYTNNELPHAFAYSVTNKSNPSAQATLADAYCDTLLGPSTAFTLAFLNASYIDFATWAMSKGVPKLCGYEGCWSPDFMGKQSTGGVSGSTWGDAWWSAVTGRTQTNPAIIQLGSSCQSSEGGTPTGNPGAVGMAVTINSSGTQFDNPGMFTRSATFAGGSSANIACTNTLVVNQAVFFVAFNSAIFPSELSTSLALTYSPGEPFSETYYVVAATSTTFQISATRGGSPIVFNTTGSGTIYMQEAWVVTAVDSANNRVTLDCNSTGFTTPTSGNMSYCKSMIYSNNLRQAGKLSPNLQTHLTTTYNDFLAAGGEFPSNYLVGGPGPKSGNVWNVLEPLNQSPNPPQWLAIIAFNH